MWHCWKWKEDLPLFYLVLLFLLYDCPYVGILSSEKYNCVPCHDFMPFSTALCAASEFKILPSYKEPNNTLVILLNIKSSNNGKYIFVEFYDWKLKGPCLECLFLNQMYILNDLNGKQKNLFYWYSKFLLLKQKAFIKEEKTVYTPLWYS